MLFLHSDSEGVNGLNVFFWSKFSAPSVAIAEQLQRSKPAWLQRHLPGTNKVLYSRLEEQYYLAKDEDTLRLLGEHFELELKPVLCIDVKYKTNA